MSDHKRRIREAYSQKRANRRMQRKMPTSVAGMLLILILLIIGKFIIFGA